MAGVSTHGGGLMYTPNLTGQWVKLRLVDPDKDLDEWAKWLQDSEYQRLLDTGPSSLFSPAAIRTWFEKEEGRDQLTFSILALQEEQLVGFVGLSGFNWQARSAWVAIGIGDAEMRRRGYGSEAMCLLAGYAFEQLNLNRINLNVFEFNARAIRSYEKVGFVHEGRERAVLNRYDRRWDMIFMGLLREDWARTQHNE
jgi:RimJ/RimL family protein N-acetyltransferase